MNYLGHAFLSAGDPQILCGNMMGDFVKGTEALSHFPEGIRKGLVLHRHIDTFTDQHDAISASKQIFRPAYGLYSGAFVDTITDYFIANDPQLFASQDELDRFASTVYARLATQSAYFPDRFRPFYESMVTHNWLSHYRSEEGLKQSLNGLKRRAAHIKEVDTALFLFREHKEMLRSQYAVFIEAIRLYVKIELDIH